MRTYHGALVALDTVFGNPAGNIHGDAALFKGRGAGGQGAVYIFRQDGNRKFVSVVAVGRNHDVLYIFCQIFPVGADFHFFGNVLCIGPISRNRQLVNSVHTGVDGCVVHGNHLFAFSTVGCYNGVFHILNSILDGDDIGQLEESRLQNGVGPVAQTQFFCLGNGVAGIYLNIVLGKIPLGVSRQMLTQFFHIPAAVQQEGAAWLDVLNYFIFFHIRRIVAGHKICLRNEISGLDRAVAEAQMRDGDAAGFFGVIFKVGLNVHISVVTDDLDGVLVGAHRTVRAKAPEFTGNSACRDGVRFFCNGNGQMRYIISDAYCKAVQRRGRLAVAECSDDTAGRGVFGAQAITAAADLQACTLLGRKSGNHIQIQGFSCGAGIFTAIQHDNRLCSGGNGSNKTVCCEGTEQADFDEPHFFAFFQQVVDSFLCGVADRTHGNQNGFCIGCTIVVKQLIICADFGIDLIHVIFHNAGNCLIIDVGSFAGLEEDVGVLSAAAHKRMVGIDGSIPEGLHSVHIHHFRQVLIIPNFDFLHLMGGAEPIEEVEERNPAANGSQMGYSA